MIHDPGDRYERTISDDGEVCRTQNAGRIMEWSNGRWDGQAVALHVVLDSINGAGLVRLLLDRDLGHKGTEHFICKLFFLR